MNYLITLKYYDGECSYYEFFTLKSPNMRNVKSQVEENLRLSQDFTREIVLESIQKINAQEFETLQKLGVV